VRPKVRGEAAQLSGQMSIGKFIDPEQKLQGQPLG